jgi:hypothetical protein
MACAAVLHSPESRNVRVNDYFSKRAELQPLHFFREQVNTLIENATEWIARVRFNDDGTPVGVERLGIAWNPLLTTS